MPSKYSVALVLDSETNSIWDNLPVGERSHRVREALKNAGIVHERDLLIEALRRRDNTNKRIISDMKLFCRCGGLKKGVEEE